MVSSFKSSQVEAVRPRQTAAARTCARVCCVFGAVGE